MGNDTSIVQAARVSYGAGTKTPSADRKLIRYLMKHRHTSPFEMCEIKLHIRLPIFIMRQWIRHRTANVNEYSARYSEMPNAFYYPSQEIMGRQANVNKQCSEGRYSTEEYQQIIEKMAAVCEKAQAVYQDLLNNHGLARETARIILPVNIFTEAYWKIDAHNLMHFLKLRVDPSAQQEMRIYAQTLLSILKEWMPITAEAFEDYVLKGKHYSRGQYEALKRAVNKQALVADEDMGTSELNQLLIDY